MTRSSTACGLAVATRRRVVRHEAVDERSPLPDPPSARSRPSRPAPDPRGGPVLPGVGGRGEDVLAVTEPVR